MGAKRGWGGHEDVKYGTSGNSNSNTLRSRTTDTALLRAHHDDDEATRWGASIPVENPMRPPEDDASLGWEEFRLLVPLGNVDRLYTGSSRLLVSSFLPRISDSSDPATYFRLLVLLIEYLWSSCRRSAPKPSCNSPPLPR